MDQKTAERLAKALEGIEESLKKIASQFTDDWLHVYIEGSKKTQVNRLNHNYWYANIYIVDKTIYY